MLPLPMKTAAQAAGPRHADAHTQAGLAMFSPLKDGCCGPAAPRVLSVAPALRRTRLADIDANIHCSIVGTCLTTAELRKLMPRLVPALDRQRATDLEIHHTAVELSTEGGLVAKELNKALDTRHALTIKRFKAADEDGLRTLWRAALASGDVPGAYWALMTHPLSTIALRTLAFGDVHMLSHLVGASNRADIRRLVALEDECGVLKEHNERQQSRLQAMSQQHQLELQQLQQQVARLTAQQRAQPAPDATEPGAQLAALRDSVRERDQALALQAARRADMEQRLLVQQALVSAQQGELDTLRSDAVTARAETHAVEQALARSLAGDDGDDGLQLLDGKCVLYVGGRPGAASVLGRLVAAAGGELLLHDGGVEERTGVLDAMLPRADMVVFPVDCISHNAMHLIKRGCERHAIDYHPVRSASVASFVELTARLAAQAAARRAPPVSHFCLRHG